MSVLAIRVRYYSEWRPHFCLGLNVSVGGGVYSDLIEYERGSHILGSNLGKA